MSKNVSELLVERLISWGVDTVFALPGDGINGIYEALRINRRRIRVIQVRHEEAAAFAACAYAKFSRRLGVCLATSGPGGVHLLNGLYDAKFDGQPVLAITGHTFHDLIGTHYQQDLDLDKLFMDVAAYNERIMGPAHVPHVVDEAIKVAFSRRTVTHINIPKDIQKWDKGHSRFGSAAPAYGVGSFGLPRPLPEPAQLDIAAEMINQGSRVVILAGCGALEAGEEVMALASRVNGVIVKALLGKAVVSDNNPYTTGGIGLLGTAPSQDAMQECDTLIIAGSSFPYMEFYPRQQVKTVQIDIDSTRIGLRHHVDVGLLGDCKEVLAALLARVRQKRDKSFLERAQNRMSRWNDLLHSQGTDPHMPMKPQVVTYQLNRLIKDDALVCTDTGSVTIWAARFIQIRGQMKFTASGTFASMANGLPYAVGAAMGNPGRQVIALCGDGGFTMLMGELATIAKYRLPVKVVVFKNNSFGHIKVEQMVLEGNPEYGVDLHPIDFQGYARACGVPGYKLDDPDKAEAVLREALAVPGPAVVEAMVDPYELPMPGHITSEQAFHFMESVLRGEKDRWKILKTLAQDKIRQVI